MEIHNSKVFTIAIVAVVVALALLEFFVLRGKVIAEGSLSLSDTEDYISVDITDTSKPYAIEVRPTGLIHNKKISMKIKIVSNNGEAIFSHTEISGKKGTRKFTFRAQTPGEYKVYVSFGPLTFGGSGRVKVAVLYNDRRLLPISLF